MDYAVCDVVAFFASESCRNKQRIHENSHTDSQWLQKERKKRKTQKQKQNKQNKTLQADAFNLLFARFVVLEFAPNT